MRILLLSSFLPYPLFSGGHIRLYNVIKHLSQEYQITLVCEKRDYQTKDDINAVSKYCQKIITVDRKKQWSWNNILKTGFSIYPFLLTGHRNVAMQKTLKDLLKQEQFDLIHIETFYVMQNLPDTKLPIVLVEHNIEYLVYKRFLKSAPVFIRPFLYIDILKLKHWEEKMWVKATKLIAVSESDKEIINKVKNDVEIVSNGVNTEQYKVLSSKYKVSEKEKRILFIGDFKWMQNRNSIQWILKEIWPKITLNSQISTLNLKLWIVGKNIPDSIKKLANDESIVIDENAPTDTTKIYQQSDILIAPIRVGGGTSFKILESMASGVPVITTHLGNAIDAKDNEEIIIAESSEDFVKNIKKLLEDKEFYQKIAKNARKLIEEKFDWEKIVGKLEEVYNLAVNK